MFSCRERVWKIKLNASTCSRKLLFPYEHVAVAGFSLHTCSDCYDPLKLHTRSTFSHVSLSPVFSSLTVACSSLRSSQSPEQRIRYQIVEQLPDQEASKLKHSPNTLQRMNVSVCRKFSSESAARCSYQHLRSIRLMSFIRL